LLLWFEAGQRASVALGRWQKVNHG
jgi:hypothetical protein